MAGGSGRRCERALAALWTMFRDYKALHGPQEARAFRAQAGRSWVSYRMG
jgi:hypothetical protein